MVSFCGFAPVEDPQVVVYVVIDEIQKGSQQNTGLAVEIARDVIEGSLKELKVAKARISNMSRIFSYVYNSMEL